MGKTITATIDHAEQLLLVIESQAQAKKTTRLFNFCMNYNYDEIMSKVRPAYKSLHQKSEKIQEYDEKFKELLLQFSAVPEAKLKEAGMEPSIRFIAVDSIDAFNAESDRLKEEYKDELFLWDADAKENEDLKRSIKIEINLYTIPTVDEDGKSLIPELEPREEYWLGFCFDYARELGGDIPDRKFPKTDEDIPQL